MNGILGNCASAVQMFYDYVTIPKHLNLEPQARTWTDEEEVSKNVVAKHFMRGL